MERTALYPGSFDPMTHGHADIIERGLRRFDRVIVGVAVNISKKPLFSLEERVGFLQARFPQPEVEIAHLDGLLVDEAKRLGCAAILRGIRNGSDFDYEFRMTCMNGVPDGQPRAPLRQLEPHQGGRALWWRDRRLRP